MILAAEWLGDEPDKFRIDEAGRGAKYIRRLYCEAATMSGWFVLSEFLLEHLENYVIEFLMNYLLIFADIKTTWVETK